MTNKRNVYLNMKELEEARAIFLGRFAWDRALGTEEIPVAEAVGRVLAEPVAAALSAPTYHGAAMDGFAVRAESTYGASDVEPKDLRVGESAYPVNTGDVLPPGTNAVIMIEHVQLDEGDESRIRIEAPAFPWQHVRKVGEDIVATEMLFTRNHRVTPYCVGALLAGGVFTVPVHKRPRVLVIPTGAEMVEPEAARGQEIAAGTIIESNSTVLGKLIEQHGGEFVRHERMKDDAELIARAIDVGTRGTFDAVLVIGGSSAGARDFARAAIDRVGEILVHGVTIMPGKPTLLAAVNDKPVVGIPGYPVSAIVAFEEFVAPALARMLGVRPPARATVRARPTRKIASKLGMEELVRVRLGKVGDNLVATPLPRGAGTVTSLTQADGILRIGTDLEGVLPHEPASVELLRPLEDIEQNLVAVGSHDLCLDLLADLLRGRQAGVSLSSSHVGSLGGIMAIKNGLCHLAGSHLLDTTDGTYNTSYVARYLADIPVELVTLVDREQGLIVRPGNPSGIEGITDLVRSGITFVNRQGGSGTRVLLDYQLEKLGIAADAIAGYETEEFTHMAVAVAVLSGAADVGLGILGAARALGLDFVPVVSERYDLIIPRAHFDSPGIQLLLDVIRSDEFRARVDALGGYSTARTGQLMG